MRIASVLLLTCGAASMAQTPALNFVLERTLTGHARFVSSVAFTPDGQWLASGCWDGTVKLWDVAKGELLFTWNAHELRVTSVAISPDGKLLATGSDDGSCKIWDLAARRIRNILKRENGYVMAVAFSADGRWLASGSSYGVLRTWEVSNGKPGRAIEAHAATVEAIAISPDSRSLASVSRDGTTKIWEIDSGKLLLAEAQRHPHGVAYSPDGRRMAANSAGEVVLWNLATGKRERSILTNATQPYISTVTYSPDSRWLATGGGPGVVELWDVDTGKHLASLRGQTGSAAEACAVTASCAIESIAISPNGRWIAAGSDDDTVKLWRLQ
jgi:WD40 repeat protein